MGDYFDSNGQNLGCPATEKEVAAFLKTLKRTSRLSDTELNAIGKTFRSQE